MTIIVGASEVPALFGVHPHGLTRLALWARKVGLDTPEPPNDEQRWGLRLEKHLLDAYHVETGHYAAENHTSFYREPLRATPDGIVQRVQGVEVIRWLVECKVTRWDPDPLPLGWLLQIQTQLLVTGLDRCDLACLARGTDFSVTTLHAHPQFAEALAPRLDAFLQAVETETPPLPESPEDLAVVKRLWPRGEPGPAVALPAEALDWDREYLEATREMAEAKARQKLAEAKLRVALGNAASGHLSSGVSYRLTTITRQGYEVAPTSYHVLRRDDGEGK